MFNHLTREDTEMKKKYFTPQIMVVKLPINKILAGSPDLEKSEEEIDPDLIE